LKATSSREKWYEVRSQREALRLAEDKRQLAPLGAIAVAIGAVAAMVKQRILNVPSVVAPRLPGRSAGEAQALIYNELVAALAEFSEERIAAVITRAVDANGAQPKRQKRRA
jgi:hypothetical protein